MQEQTLIPVKSEGRREGSSIPIIKFKERSISNERPHTDMKNIFLKIRFLNHYATTLVLLIDRATHTHTHTHTNTHTTDTSQAHTTKRAVCQAENEK